MLYQIIELHQTWAKKSSAFHLLGVGRYADPVILSIKLNSYRTCTRKRTHARYIKQNYVFISKIYKE